MRAGTLLLIALGVATLAGACGSEIGLSEFGNGAGGDGGTGADVANPAMLEDDGSTLLGDGSDLAAISIMPLDKVIDVTSGLPLPTVHYAAISAGKTVGAVWSVDRGEIGAIDPATGHFTPNGTIGGKATISANFKGRQASTSVTVKIHVVQNGDPSAGDAGGGAGGNGGVGGEGPGAAVSDATKMALLGAPVADPGLAWLYPYDKTVWPRGILAPLLQWKPGAQAYDAVYVHVTETAFEYQGFFKQTADPFIHHPIPQSVWKQMGYSNGGEDVTVTLVFSKGASTYGPLTETWKIAQGSLKGTVYYNSYGTNLAKNYCCAIGGQSFGGATLAIKGGSTDPVLIAGNDQNCRVCHSVAANGSMLITQHDDNAISSAYDLTSNNTETVLTPQDGRYAWPALTPDGTMMFSNSGPQQGGNPTLPSALYAVAGGAAIAASGIPAGLKAACPAFSPDGKHVAFNNWGGAAADQKSLAMLDFDATTKTFSGMQTLHTPTPASATVVWPSFLPSSDGIVFEKETVYNGRDFAGTRANCDAVGGCGDVGTRAELWWLDLKTKTAHALDLANGGTYLPIGPNAHDADATLNYEPTINPVPSGGYAWVVFTSRRTYGNVATINPYYSDPRVHDISVTPTTKKLWVAAIDLNAPAGTDPSHPAFYLPAQELLAGNARGFWVVDPCHTNGTSCETGDECCGGFCRPSGDGGLACVAQGPGCAQEFEKCAVTADCCGHTQGYQCVNGRCAVDGPK